MIPLHDHFRPPLSVRRHWHSFHHAWCTYLASHLNEQLPERFFAEPNVQYGIEVDVAALDAEDTQAVPFVPSWDAPPPTQTIPLILLNDVVEVLVYSQEGGPTLAGAIELVSPSNKDRPASRDALISKCATYLQQGLGLILIDVVTERRANLHQELLARLQHPDGELKDADLYAVSYRPLVREEAPSLDMWERPLAIAGELPALPLWLRGNLCFRVDLAATYDRTCREQRIVAAGA
jgi:hypothetical protein